MASNLPARYEYVLSRRSVPNPNAPLHDQIEDALGAMVRQATEIPRVLELRRPDRQAHDLDDVTPQDMAQVCRNLTLALSLRERFAWAALNALRELGDSDTFNLERLVHFVSAEGGQYRPAPLDDEDVPALRKPRVNLWCELSESSADLLVYWEHAEDEDELPGTPVDPEDTDYSEEPVTCSDPDEPGNLLIRIPAADWRACASPPHASELLEDSTDEAAAALEQGLRLLSCALDHPCNLEVHAWPVFVDGAFKLLEPDERYRLHLVRELRGMRRHFQDATAAAAPALREFGFDSIRDFRKLRKTWQGMHVAPETWITEGSGKTCSAEAATRLLDLVDAVEYRQEVLHALEFLAHNEKLSEAEIAEPQQLFL